METAQGAPRQGAMPGWGLQLPATAKQGRLPGSGYPPESGPGAEFHPSAHFMGWERKALVGPKWDGKGSF